MAVTWVRMILLSQMKLTEGVTIPRSQNTLESEPRPGSRLQIPNQLANYFLQPASHFLSPLVKWGYRYYLSAGYLEGHARAVWVVAECVNSNPEFKS